ncbi:S-layer domain-containing protein [Paenibacillus mucilaginosus 3016]|uniref:S-layer domain-containing protein n=1 Tax=Paenibacillus mucilaginosus 3016 TaxID=1116391 RepID=H6NS45_9BACL|nr:S-layer homology domain-containing protein [Paenibacillus mucilaginosus]AFC27339.1 S-layer domain-containing protein [Paenibacillus mucilaginosus 3016]WFA16250.1 S-layer homology domain-containing protein [Paenibacillus mucilaginosus]
MKGRLKTALAASLLFSAFGGFGGGGTAVLAAGFNDIENHWAKETITWGQQEGLISGYPDGTFKPNAQVTEAEFVKMMVASFKTEVSEVQSPKHWADAYYYFAESKNYPLKGYQELAQRDKPITRERVAEFVVGTVGKNYSGDQAIQYLIGYKLASGKVEGDMSIASFKGQDTLTRGEAAQFIRNLKLSNVNYFRTRPFEPSPVSELPQLPGPTQQGLNQIMYTLNDKVITKFPAYGVRPVNHDGHFDTSFVVVYYGENKHAMVLNIEYDPKTKSIIRFNFIDGEKEGSVEMFAAAVQALGFPVPNDFSSTLRAVMSENKAQRVNAGQRTLLLKPNELVVTRMEIFVE